MNAEQRVIGKRCGRCTHCCQALSRLSIRLSCPVSTSSRTAYPEIGGTARRRTLGRPTTSERKAPDELSLTRSGPCSCKRRDETVSANVHTAHRGERQGGRNRATV